jgi:prokaryotic ubiquitin-like protein Pup
MATRDTPAGGGQQRATRRGDGSTDDTAAHEAHDAVEAREHQDQLDDDVDSVLNEIDAVLEENAEDFVRSFVQKGGE